MATFSNPNVARSCEPRYPAVLPRCNQPVYAMSCCRKAAVQFVQLRHQLILPWSLASLWRTGDGVAHVAFPCSMPTHRETLTQFPIYSSTPVSVVRTYPKILDKG